MDYGRINRICWLVVFSLLFWPSGQGWGQSIDEALRREGATSFDSRIDGDYLQFPTSPNEIYLDLPVWQEMVVYNDARPLPEGVRKVNLEAGGEDMPFTIKVGYRFRPIAQGPLSLDAFFVYRRFYLVEHIEASESGSFSIYRKYDCHAYELTPCVLGLNLRNFTFYIGLNHQILSEQVAGQEEFIFYSLDGLADILPDNPPIVASGDEVRVFREPTAPYTQVYYLNIGFYWGVGYRRKISDNLFIELATTNPIEMGPRLFTQLTARSLSRQELWEQHFFLHPRSRQVEGRDYFSIRLGYNFNQKRRIQRKLGF